MKLLDLTCIAEAREHRARGQILVLAALAMLTIVGGVAIVIDGGNAYANQRSSQNATDASAEAGATVIAEYLSLNQTGKTDADVHTAIDTAAHKNGLEEVSGYYTNYQGRPIDANGVLTTQSSAVWIGQGTLPHNVQGVRIFGQHVFHTYFAGVVGFPTFTVETVATAVAGKLTGGVFLPVVVPISISGCTQNGSLGAGVNETAWHVSQPATPPTTHPAGQEYIVPLCKTGGGNFMILDLDPNLNCQQEVENPPAVQWNLPTWIPADNGNDCAKKIADVMPKWYGHVVTVPICDSSLDQPCSQQGNGSNAEYHVVKVAAFWVDHMYYQNNGSNPNCNSAADGSLITIAGNGSDSCLVGWFVRYVTVGPISQRTNDLPGNADAIGIQLIE